MCAENNSLHCSTSAQSLCFRGISLEVVEKTMHNVNGVKGLAHKVLLEFVNSFCVFFPAVHWDTLLLASPGSVRSLTQTLDFKHLQALNPKPQVMVGTEPCRITSAQPSLLTCELVLGPSVYFAV